MVPLHSPAPAPFPKPRSLRSLRSVSSRPAAKQQAKHLQSRSAVTYAGVKPPVHVQISDLHKKIQLLEGDRKCFHESTQWTIKKNKETIKQLREENKISHQKLSDLFIGDEKVVRLVIREWKEEKPYLKNKNGEEALALMDHRLSEKVKQLNALRYEAEQRQKRIEELQLQYSLRELETIEFQDNDSEVAKTIRNLENRLEKARLKADEAEYITRVYLQLKAYMQEESLHFEKKLDAMEGEVKRLRHEFSELQNLIQDATGARDAAKSELQKLEENLFKDRKERDRVLMEAKKRTEEKKVQNERIERKTQQRDQVPVQSEEFLTDAQGTKTSKLKNLWATYQTEIAFDRLKVATGISDPSSVVSRFLAQRETFAHLESLKQENEVKLTSLKIEKQRLQQELIQLKYSGEAKAIRDQQVLVELQKYLDIQEKQVAEAKEKMQNTILSLQLAKSGVEHLADKLQHIPVIMCWTSWLRMRRSCSNCRAIWRDRTCQIYCTSLLSGSSMPPWRGSSLLTIPESCCLHQLPRTPSLRSARADPSPDPALGRSRSPTVATAGAGALRLQAGLSTLRLSPCAARAGARVGPGATRPAAGVRAMERPPGKELALAPLQEWGEEEVDGAVYNVILRRQRSQRPGPGGGRERGRGQAPDPGRSEDFVHYRTCKVRALRSAPLQRLVLELVRGDHEQDPAFVPAFLATHRAFVPTDHVLRLLLPLRQAPRPQGKGPEEQGQGHLDLSQEQESRALISVLGSWLLDHPQDFKDPPAHSNLVQVCTFLSWAAPGGAESQEAERLLKHFQEEEETKKLQKEEERAKEAPAVPELSHYGSPGPENPLEEEEDHGKECPELLDFSVDEVAEQLTLMDMELFSQVCLWECLGSVWSHRDKAGGRGTAPSVRATVAQFNAVTSCVLSSVLAGPGLPPPHRAQRLEKWIFIAQRCRELRNFSSLRAILSALQSNPIYRLKRSWAAVSREPLSLYRKLSNIFSDENNHLNSREILSQEEASLTSPEEETAPGVPPLKVSPGPIPYLGTFLTDLVMLDTALPDLLEGDFINFEKRRKEWEILSRIQHLQRRCMSYSLPSRPPVLAAFRAQRPLSEEQSTVATTSLKKFSWISLAESVFCPLIFQRACSLPGPLQCT
ncbi:uncharacterized protein [Notamacropus eugenii]|uniref:uncharacterized protein isoform X3 n=1 Tax=Notamacropus eugenii TaxID=9315 RepID=UPI003B681B78